MRLASFFADLLAPGLPHRFLQLVNLLGQIDGGQCLAHRLGAHLGHKGVGPVGFAGLAIFEFAQQLIGLERSLARINDQVVLIVDDPLQIARGHVQNQTDARRHALEKPNVTDRHRQLNVPHALAPHPGQRDFHAAPVANHAAMLDAFVFAAGTLPILDRTKDAFAEQAAFLGLEGAVIDGFGILDFALGP